MIDSAIAAVAPDAAGFAGLLLHGVSHQLAGGLTLEQALPTLRDRMKIDCVTLFVTTVITCKRGGGPMAECLDAVAESVRERQRSEHYADVQTASGRQQVRLLAGFPVAFVLLMLVLFPAGHGHALSRARAARAPWCRCTRLSRCSNRPPHH